MYVLLNIGKTFACDAGVFFAGVPVKVTEAVGEALLTETDEHEEPYLVEVSAEDAEAMLAGAGQVPEEPKQAGKKPTRTVTVGKAAGKGKGKGEVVSV